MGGPVGGRVGRISFSVQHNYWSLDTNNGRAKEDLVCVHTPPPLLLSCSATMEVYGIEGKAAPFGAALYIWKIGLSARLAMPLPHPMWGRVGLELHMEETNTATLVAN